MGIIKYLFVETYNRVFAIKILNLKVWNYISGSISSLLAVSLYVKNVTDGPGKADILYSIISGILFYVIIFILLFLFSFYLTLKDKLYYKYITQKIEESTLNSNENIQELNKYFTKSIKLLNQIFIKVHNFKNKYNNSAVIKIDTEKDINDDFIEVLYDLCVNLKEVFETFNSSTAYSVSVKIPVNFDANSDVIVDEKSSLQTICRDPNSKERETPFYVQTAHSILGNTAFTKCLNNTITRKKIQYYINNNIQISEDYTNTSAINGDLNTLSYKSELVFPLISYSNNIYTCKGFICCDCSEKNGFKNDLFVEIIQGICDGIYDFFILKDNLNRQIVSKPKIAN
jgi:hypothetical protein